MGLIQNYRKWSILHQVQILFITSSFVVCGVLVLITKYQLDWVRDVVIREASDTFKSRLYVQIENIGQVQASYFESEFSSYEDFTIHLAHTDELINGFNKNYSAPVFQPSTSHLHDSIEKSPEYGFGVYYSRFSSLSSAGSALVRTESILNSIYPSLYTDYFLSYYQGYYIDQILNIYPGYTFTSNYSPLPREWFYRGALNGHNVTITEPYKDAATGAWIMSMSRGILNDSQVFGVAACDISISTLVEKVKKIKILDKGFAVLVSATGIVLTVPDGWTVEDTKILRIFDTETTRIPLAAWIQIRNDSPSAWVDSDFQGNQELGLEAISYKIFKKNISPQYQNNVTHYLLLILDKKELNDVEDNLKESFSSTYEIIFTIIYIISIIVFTLVVVFCWVFGKKITQQFQEVGQTLADVLRKAFYCRAVNVNSFTMRRTEKFSGIGSFNQALIDKISEIEIKEAKIDNPYFFRTRPDDFLLFDEWKRNLYPRYKTRDLDDIWDYRVDKTMIWLKDLR